MGKKGHRYLARVGVLILVAGLVLSCGPQKAATPAPQATPVAATPVAATPAPAATAPPAATPRPATPVPTPTATPAPAKPVELKAAIWTAPTFWLLTDVLEPWARQVEKDTGGRVKMTWYPAEALGKAKDYFDMIRSGGVDVAIFASTYTPGLFPMSGVAELPFAVPVASTGTSVLWELYQKGYLEAEYKDIKVLWLWVGTPYQLYTAKKRVLGLEDLKGMKARTPGGVMTPTLEALGATPVSVTAPEMYAAMERGVIEAISLSYAVGPGYKLQEITKYIAEVGFGVVTLGVGMNRKVWDGLPADVKAVLEQTSDWGRKATARAYEENDTKAQDIYYKAGVQIYSLPAAERTRWMERTRPIWDQWVSDMEKKGLSGKKALDEFRVLSEKAGVKLPF